GLPVEPLARALPRLRPRAPLRAVLVSRELPELLQVGNRSLRVERHPTTLTRALECGMECGCSRGRCRGIHRARSTKAMCDSARTAPGTGWRGWNTSDTSRPARAAGDWIDLTWPLSPTVPRL